MADPCHHWQSGDGVAIGAIPAVGVVGVVGPAPVSLLAGLVAVAGSLRGAGDAARYVLVPGVTEQSGTPIERAAGLYDGMARLATLIGAPTAGVLIAVSSPLAVLAVDAVTFLASATLVAATVPRNADPSPSDTGERSRYLASLRAGLHYLRGDRLLLGIAIMVLATNTIAFSLGAVLGNLGLSWLAPRLPRRLVYGVGFLVAVEYERVPRHLQARVLGVVGATAWAGMPLGSLGGGTLVGVLGLRPVLWIAALCYFTVTLAPFVFPAWREMDQQRPQPGETSEMGAELRVGVTEKGSIEPGQ